MRRFTLAHRITTALAAAGILLATDTAQAQTLSLPGRADSLAVLEVVNAYHTALASGDSAKALSLLADDAVILESGGVETRSDYRSHHLPADIQFARAVPNERSIVSLTVRDGVAWVSSTSTTRGEYRGRQVNSVGAELMVLTQEPDGWRIRAIHWSSRARRP